jgi:predicted molibdopterin-dependent oxidoreductase YjgC
VQASMTHLRLPQVERGGPFKVDVNGEPVVAYPGETVATVLLAAGCKSFSIAAGGSPRGLYCGIGRCYSCLVTIDGAAHQRACVTLAQPGMQIVTGQTLT